MTPAVILLLAAGAARRMRGADKLLEQVDGIPLLRRQALAALETGAPVIVTLPPDAPRRRAALEGLAVQLVEVADAALGMGHSLAAGASAAPKGAALLVMLADMPEIGTPDLRRVLDARDGDTVARGATPEGAPGHPVLFPPRLRPALVALTGDAGAREVLRGETVRLVPLEGNAALTDLDTPEAWADWRARNAT